MFALALQPLIVTLHPTVLRSIRSGLILPHLTLLRTVSTLLKVYDPVGTRVRGKITRDVLDKVFGPALLATLSAYGNRSAAHVDDDLSQGYSERGGGIDVENKRDVLAGNDGVAGKLQVTHSHWSGRMCNICGMFDPFFSLMSSWLRYGSSISPKTTCVCRSKSVWYVRRERRHDWCREVLVC